MNYYCQYCTNELPESKRFCTHCGKNLQDASASHHLAHGTILNDKYYVGAAIGEGGFGITYIGRDLTLNMRVAIKEYYPNGFVNRNNTVSQTVNAPISQDRSEVVDKGCQKFIDEAHTLARFISEPGIVGVRDFFRANGTAYIVMDYLDGITLKEYIQKQGKLTPAEAIDLLLPVMHSLHAIHAHGLIHRDISPDNIMLVKDGSKLIDFGAARDVSGDANKSLSVMLKAGYAPEEQYRSKSGKQGPWTDVYALSATIYRCITGVVPEDAIQRLDIDELKTPAALGVTIDSAVQYALLKGLQVRQENRYPDVKSLVQGLLGNDPALAAYKGIPASAQTAATPPTATPDDGMTVMGSRDDGMTVMGSRDDGMTVMGSRDDGMTVMGDRDDGMTVMGSRDDGMTVMGDRDENYTPRKAAPAAAKGSKAAASAAPAAPAAPAAEPAKPKKRKKTRGILWLFVLIVLGVGLFAAKEFLFAAQDEETAASSTATTSTTTVASPTSAPLVEEDEVDIDGILAQADDLVLAGDYPTAIALLEAVETDTSDAAITAALETLRADYVALLLTQAEDSFASDGYLAAIALLEAGEEVVGEQEALNDAIATYRSYAPQEELEDNDTAGTATAMMPNAIYSGNISEVFDLDWYAVELDAAGVLNLSFAHESLLDSSVYWYIALCSMAADGTTSAFNTWEIGGNTTEWESCEIGLPEGTYYIYVYSYAKAANNSTKNWSDVTYELAAQFEPTVYAEQESNDTLYEATLVETNATYQGSTHKAYDYDWYQVQTTESGLISLSFLHDSLLDPDTYWCITLYQDLGEYATETFATWEISGNDVDWESYQIGVSAGSYYICVQSYARYKNNTTYDWSDVAYEFTVLYLPTPNAETEFNDTIYTANPLAANTVYQGNNHTMFDEDWYYFDLSADATITLSFAHDSLFDDETFWYVSIYQDLGEYKTSHLADYSITGNATTWSSESFDLTSGRYYILIQSYGAYKNNSTYNWSGVPYSFNLSI